MHPLWKHLQMYRAFILFYFIFYANKRLFKKGGGESGCQKHLRSQKGPVLQNVARISEQGNPKWQLCQGDSQAGRG